LTVEPTYIGIEIDQLGSRKVNRQAAGQGKIIPKAASTTPLSGKKIDKSASRVTTRKNLEAQEKSSSSPLIIIIIAASLAGFAYIQSDLVESLTGFNLKRDCNIKSCMLHTQ
jgi:hypothetical protein